MDTYILHIHSGHQKCSVALSCQDSLLYYRESNHNQSHHQQLPVLIQSALCLIEGKELVVHLYKGPGSYTGLRIGYSIVKGLCFGGTYPLICSDAGELYFQEYCTSNMEAEYCLSVFHARKNEVYAQLFHRQKAALWPEMRSIFLGESEVESQLAGSWNKMAIVGNAANLFAEYYPQFRLVWPLELNALHMVEAGKRKWKNKSISSLSRAKPLYLKPPHINTHKKKHL